MNCHSFCQHFFNPFFVSFLLELFSMVIIFSFSPWSFLSSMSNLSSSTIRGFYNLFTCLIFFSTTLNISTPLMLSNVEFVFACDYFWAFKAWSISKPFELTIHMLCKHMQTITKFGIWCNGISIILSKILNFPSNILKVLSINILCLWLDKIPMCFVSWHPIFSPFNGE